MIIGIIPVVLQKKNIYHYVDYRLIAFLKFCFGAKIKIIILTKKDKHKLDFIVSSGGNDLLQFDKSMRNIIRNNLDEFYLKMAIKKKISYLGICFGAQKIAKYFGSSFSKSKLHVNCSHKIKFHYQQSYLKRMSYHNYKIKKLNLPLVNKGIALNDNSCEFFNHKTKKIYGIMWHPERNKKFSLIEKKLIFNMI